MNISPHPRLFPRRASLLFLLIFSYALSGCEAVLSPFGYENPAKKAAREADAKAVGSACRHSGRAIEDCFSVYHWLPREFIFTGWREMDNYMRENEIQTVEPQLPPALPPPPPPPPPEPPAKKKKKKKVEGESEQSGPPPLPPTTIPSPIDVKPPVSPPPAQ